MEGKNLWNAVDLVVRAGNEIEALETELSNKMTESLRVSGGKLGFKFEEGSGDAIASQGDWVTIATLMQWGLKEKSKKTRYTGNLSIQVVLWSDSGDKDPCGKLPRVEVAYVGSEDDVSPSYSEPGTWFEPDGWGDYFVSCDGKCISTSTGENISIGSAWNQNRNWYFAVPLFGLESTEHIDSLIIKPVMELLSGTAPEIALKNVTAIEFSIGKDGVLSAAQQIPVCS